MSEPLLSVRGLHQRFGEVVTAENVSFDVAAGSTLGIVGPNGAGKSTLLDLITGRRRPDAGSVRFDGLDVTSLDPARRSIAGIGRTHQVPRPFASLTVFENTLVGATFAGGGRGRAARTAALTAIETCGLSRLTNVPAGRLGLLDRKRLELARALATTPRLILLDEIAGGLTEPELPELITVVRALRDAGVAVVWIEHILHALLQVVDRLLCLAQGRVLALGEPAAVIGSREVIEVYLGSTVDLGQP